MTLKVYNTLSREKEEFQPVGGKRRVGMYVCGPTVYDHCHVGHARSYIAFDVIRRYLEYKGYAVTYIQNFTDVDDKIIARAKELGIHPLELSKKYIKSYFDDMKELNVKRASYHPLASELIPEMIEVIETLIKKGHAYEVNGSVYFSVDSARDKFGQLTHQKLEDMLDGARVEVDENKRNPKDFALWKRAKRGEISWQSPWGRGRPGWHIECSTMANTYIGETLDIHGGGMDLIFPHHESEILQAESATGKKFAKYWLHNGFININKEKMSKSLGNFFTIKEILKEFDPMVLRFFLVNTHYRREIEFSKEALEEAGRAFQRLTTFRRKLEELLNGKEEDTFVSFQSEESQNHPEFQKVEEFKKGFINEMDDDFNTRGAIAVLFEMVAEGNKFLSSIKDYSSTELGVVKYYAEVFDQFFSVLGLKWKEERKTEEKELISSLLSILLSLRNRAREKKDWKTADEIRERLKKLGIALEDDGMKTIWRFVTK